MRTATAAVALLLASACKAPPARLVTGASDTVVVNNQRPVHLPVRVLDARGRVPGRKLAGPRGRLRVTLVVNFWDCRPTRVRRWREGRAYRALAGGRRGG
jgi:hypothetical protein